MPIALDPSGLRLCLWRAVVLPNGNATAIKIHRGLLERASFHVAVISWLHQDLDLLRDKIALDDRVRRQDSFDVAKPSGEFPIPVDRRLESVLESCPLLPAQRVQLRAIDSVAAVVKFPVVRMLNPSFHVGFAEQAEKLFRELDVRDLILRINVVGLTDFAFVQDGVEGLCCIAGVEVAACVLSVAMQQQWLATAKQVDEFWYDLCVVLVMLWHSPSALLTFRVLEVCQLAVSAAFCVQALIPGAVP
jgi:hypothetical protein